MSLAEGTNNGDEKDSLIVELRKQILLLQSQVEDLTAKLKEKDDIINLLLKGRNSKNSSMPPSQDLLRSNKKSLREPSTRKPGGQAGHEGSNLSMSANPDKTESYYPSFCQCCGHHLEGEELILSARRQEIVIPPVIPQYIEYRSYKATCSRCGHLTEAKMPSHLKANIQYGMQLNTLVAYLNVRQYLPYNRIKELMGELFGVCLSEGTIDNMIQSLSEKAQPVYEQIRQRLQKAEVVGGDETGITIKDKKAWLFAVQTSILTYLHVSFSRSYEAIVSVFSNGFPLAVYVSDCYAAQLKVHAKLHQICLVHLLRELNRFCDALSCEWSAGMKALFKDAIELKKQLAPHDYHHGNERVNLLQARLDLLLQYPPAQLSHQKVRAFQKRLIKNRKYIFTFLYHEKVPPDNNDTETAIRTAKVKMKVSSMFRSERGANNFAVLRSVMDTAIKNTQNIWKAFDSVAKAYAE